MIRRFFLQALLYHKGRTAAFSLEEFLLFDAAYPLITMCFYCIVASVSFNTNNLTNWVIGNSFLLCTNTCVFALGGIFISERYNGRLRSLIVAPCSKLMVIIESGVFPALQAIATVLVGFTIGSLVFKVRFTGINIGYVMATIICAMISATCFGLFISIFGLLSDNMQLVLNVISYVLLIFTGAEFPVSQLPFWGQIISKVLPLTHSLDAMKMLYNGEVELFWKLNGIELAVAGAYAISTWLVFWIVERIARCSGKFDTF